MSITTFSLPMANGVTSVALNSGALGQFEIMLKGTTGAPSAGTLKVEGLNWANNYDVIAGATAVNLTTLGAGPIILSDFGHFQALRFTLAGVTGGSGQLYGAAVAQNFMLPDFVATGGRALNTQNYSESNVKLGTQFYFQKKAPTFSAATTYNIAFVTGALPVLIKSRSLYTDAITMSVQLFKAPTGVTGGTAIPVQNYNDINPKVSTVTVTGDVTVTTTGTAWGDPERVINAGASGQRSGSGLAPGADRILATNSSYLIQLINVSGSAEADYFLTWFEGQPDLPRK